MSELIRKLKEKKFITKVKVKEDISDELLSKEISQTGSVKIVEEVKKEIGPVKPPYAVMRETNPELMDVCVANGWAANNDYMTYEEAAAITNDMLVPFNGVINFEEFQYFTGITYTLASNCFQNCTSLTSIKIPNSVTRLDDNCFQNCTNLTSITIPDSVKPLGPNCFSGCTSLTSITIPESIKLIDWSCFSGCTNLTSIEISSSVTSIGVRCFQGCTNLNSITCLATTAPGVGSDTFGSYSSNYTGKNTKPNKLKVPTGATGYDTGAWLDPLQDASKCGFTIEYI